MNKLTELIQEIEKNVIFLKSSIHYLLGNVQIRSRVDVYEEILLKLKAIAESEQTNGIKREFRGYIVYATDESDFQSKCKKISMGDTNGFKKVEPSEQSDAVAKERNEMWGMLKEINDIMWESYFVKGIEFGRPHGEKIMEVICKWADKY